MNVVFFGHHKCGTRFFRGIFADLAKLSGRQLVAYKIEHPVFHFRICADLDRLNMDFARLKGPDPIVMSAGNADPAFVRLVDAANPDFRGLRVIRDPRQVIVSNYFHHREGHAIEGFAGWRWDQLAEDRPHLVALPEEDGILYEMAHISADILDNMVFGWQPDPRIIETKLEDVTETSPFWADIRNWLGLEQVPPINWAQRHANVASGPWRAHFTPRIKAAFKERWGQNLIDTGYATDFDW